MRTPWDVSAHVAAELGEDGLAQLDGLDPTSELTCQVCGHVKPAGDPTPMAVVIANDPRGMLVVGFAHAACRDRVGDHWPGLLGRLNDPTGLDAQAFFGIRASARLRAVMAFEPAAMGRVQTADGDGIDAYVALHLEAGFTLARADVLDLVVPTAPGWGITARGGELTLAHDSLGIDYTQPLNDDLRRWLKAARRDGAALVLTGTGLGLTSRSGALPDFSWARRRGQLAAATVPLR